jgi:hypothetical protein
MTCPMASAHTCKPPLWLRGCWIATFRAAYERAEACTSIAVNSRFGILLVFRKPASKATPQVQPDMPRPRYTMTRALRHAILHPGPGAPGTRVHLCSVFSRGPEIPRDADTPEHPGKDKLVAGSILHFITGLFGGPVRCSRGLFHIISLTSFRSSSRASLPVLACIAHQVAPPSVISSDRACTHRLHMLSVFRSLRDATTRKI